MNRRHLTIAALAAAAALVLSGCQTEDPASSIPPIGSETAEPTETDTPTEPTDVTVPPPFDPPTSEDEALEQAAAHVEAYQEVHTYAVNNDDGDVFSSWAEAGALTDAVDRYDGFEENGLTAEGAPTFEYSGGYASQADDLDYGHAEVTGCLDVSTMTIIREDEEQPGADNPRGEGTYSLVYRPDLGHWMIQTEEATGESC